MSFLYILHTNPLSDSQLILTRVQKSFYGRRMAFRQTVLEQLDIQRHQKYDRISKATKKKNGKVDFIKFKNFCSTKDLLG